MINKKLTNLSLMSLFLFTMMFGLTISPGEVQARKLKFLTTTAMSGPFAGFGVEYDKAIRMAVEEANKRGLKNGWDGIEYKVVDTEAKPSLTQQKLLREAKTWKPDAVFGGVLETDLRIWNVRLPRLKIPGLVGGHMGMSKHMPPGEVPLSKWVMYYGFPGYYSGWLAGKVFHKMGVKRVGFIGGDYDWGYDNSAGLKAYYLENGKPFDLVMIGYTPLDKADMTVEAIQVKKAKIDGLFVAYSRAGWFSIPAALKDINAFPEYFVYEVSYSNIGNAKISGAYGAEGVYTIGDHNPKSKDWRDFVTLWRKYYGAQSYPGAYTGNQFTSTNFAIKAFEKMGPNVKDPDKIVENLQKTVHKDVLFSPMGPIGPFGGNHGAKATLVKFVKGADKTMDPEFPIHEELQGVYELEKWNAKDLMQKMKKLGKMENGDVYPAAK
jgi:ABC-type branched-subunit amino acid transport system substrate-binding protein